ncbi:MAG TPA: tRNA-dihydrouridine synthase [Candidatus Dojkabacteria bacterium]|nr:tRNA-dihydrouridine synthase [Candidatus Dojkabacteria bacterium]
MNIYKQILEKKGYILALAPMEGVTDTVFRQVICEIGKPDLFFTEFLNVEGFCSKGKEKVIHRLAFRDIERPIIIQLWGNVPEYYVETIEYLKQLKPDGIDINMGCSVRDVLSGGRGSALINDKVLAGEIIEAVKQSVGNIPVSVKTRIGFEKIETEEWIGFLLEQGLDMITVHGRLSREGYATPSRWDEIARSVKLRDSISPKTVILRNGDVKSKSQAEQYVEKYNTDGVLIGRAILNNPWLFSEDLEKQNGNISKEERITTLLHHLDIFEKEKGDMDIFNSQKKYIKAYISNFEGAVELRTTLMNLDTVEGVREVLLQLVG